MMSNLNFNIYDLPPTQHYQEYGVYDETNDTSAEPLVYVPTIDSIQYTGVTSFEFNGTTYYNYNLYEAPVLSLYSYPVYDYVPEVYSNDYQYGDNTAFVDDTDDTLFSTHYSQYSKSHISSLTFDFECTKQHQQFNLNRYITSYDSTSSHLSIDSNLSVTYDISHSNFISSSIQCRNSFNNISDEDNNSYILENNVSFTEPTSSCNSFLTLNENAERNYQSDLQRNNEVENISPITNEDTDFQNGDDSYLNISVINIKHDANVSNESFEQSVDINENELNEHCYNYSFISEDSKVLDWSIELENDDLEEEEGDDDNDEEDDNDDDGDYDDDDANKVNFSTLSDIDPYYSTEVVKHLKEQLYLYALSGHMSLKESLPVVDILPIIEEDSESVENDDIFETTVEDLENREGNTRSVIEDNILYNVSIDISEPLVENHGIELENEKLEQVKTKITSETEDDTKSFPIFNMSQKSVSNNKLHTAQRHEVVNTDDKLTIQESKDVPTQPSSVEESIIFDENVLKLADTDVLVFRDAGSGDKCYSEGTVEKTSENEEKVLIKEEKKKLHTFRKWLTNLCCCVRKKT